MTNGKEVWWRLYRLKQSRRRKKINLPIAIRSILKTCFWEYARNCSIGGIRQMSDLKNPLKYRIVWVIIFCGMCMILFYYLWYLLFNNLSAPLAVSLETSTYPISELDFPAVALCNVNRISKKALLEFEKNVFGNKEGKDIRQTITWQMGGLIDYIYNESHIISYIERVQSPHKYAKKVVGSMKRLAPKCDEMLVDCMWAGVGINCKKIFTARRTFRGHCCAFNYILEYEEAWTPTSTMSTPKRQLRPGQFFGLNLMLDPLIEDYAYTTRSVSGIEVLVFDSTHYADPNGARLMQRIAEPNKAVYLELSSTKQIATSEVKKYSLPMRRCRFRDEMKEKFNNMYSYSACIVNCRITTVKALCKCVPYFMPTSPDTPSCTLEQLPCLNKHKEKLLLMYPMGAQQKESLSVEFQDSLYCPDCLPDCEYTRHKTRVFKTDIPQFLYAGLSKQSPEVNLTNKCFVSIYQSTFYGSLERLDVVSYWYELVSDVGGVGGILIALSIFSILEFVYFFIVKFFADLCYLFFNKF